MRVILLSVCLVLGSLGGVSGLKILVMVGMASKSHKLVFEPLVQALADQKHTVTIVSPFAPKKAYPGVREVTLEWMEKFTKKFMEPNGDRKPGDPIADDEEDDSPEMQELRAVVPQARNPFDDEKDGLLEVMPRLHAFVKCFCRKFWKEEQVLALLKETDFDVGIYDGLFNECELPLFHHMGIPYLGIFPTGLFGYVPWIHSVPTPYSYLSFSNVVRGPEMGFVDRLKNTIAQLVITYMQKLHYSLMDQVLVESCPLNGVPPIAQLVSDASVLLVNSHSSIDYVRPSMPHVINVGGITVKRVKAKLEADLQKFLDTAPQGVIYFSFGSVVQAINMPVHIRKAFLAVFSKISQRVIWKFENPSLFGPDEPVPPNVKFIQWAPQQEILDHPKTLMFISHGGMLSLTEAVYFGVPCILIPFFGDQHANVGKAVYKGNGLHLALDNLTQSGISWAVNEMATNQKYKMAVSKMSDLLRDQAIHPVDHAIWWIKHIHKNKGGKHLKNEQVATLSFIQYFLIDVILSLVGAILAVIFAIYAILKFVLRKICRGGKTPKTPKKKTN